VCVSSPSSPTEVYVRYLPVFCLSAYLLATLLARRIVAKVADWIRMLSWVGRGMGVLDWDSDRSSKGSGSFGGKFGTSHGNQRGLCSVVVQQRRALH